MKSTRSDLFSNLNLIICKILNTNLGQKMFGKTISLSSIDRKSVLSILTTLVSTNNCNQKTKNGKQNRFRGSWHTGPHNAGKYVKFR